MYAGFQRGIHKNEQKYLSTLILQNKYSSEMLKLLVCYAAKTIALPLSNCQLWLSPPNPARIWQ